MRNECFEQLKQKRALLLQATVVCTYFCYPQQLISTTMKTILLRFLFVLSTFSVIGQTPEILMFETSRCTGSEEQEKMRVTSQRWLNDSTVMIGIKFYGNCCDDAYQDLTTESDTLTIHYGTNFEIHPNGEVESEVCLCNCNYAFKYLITNVKSNYFLRMRYAAAQTNSHVLTEVKREE